MVLGLDGNQYLGGDDFDQAMAHWVEEKLGVKIISEQEFNLMING